MNYDLIKISDKGRTITKINETKIASSFLAFNHSNFCGSQIMMYHFRIDRMGKYSNIVIGASLGN